MLTAQSLASLAADASLSLTSAPLRHFPLIRAAITELGITEVLNEVLPPDPRMKVTDAECITLMIINALQGRIALYHMADWLEGTDAEVLLGRDCPVGSFTDTRLAETLDRIFKAGTDDVLSAVALRYLQSDRCPTSYNVHQDTTTITLQGAYADSPEPEAGTDPKPAPKAEEPLFAEQPVPVPKHGYSKDHRPDLLQLVFGLNLQGSVGVPLCVSVLDGNTSDPVANQFHIDRLSGLLPPSHEVTLVADSKLCDAPTLGLTLDAGFHVVTLVPRAQTIRDELVERVRLSGEELPPLVLASRRTKSEGPRFYRGRSFVAPYAVLDPETEERVDREMRFLVVSSPRLEATEEASIRGQVNRERKEIEEAYGKLAKRPFSCPEDAERAAKSLRARRRFHEVSVEVTEREVVQKRAQRGRPRKGEATMMETVWALSALELRLDEARVERARFHAKHFVLITDHLDEVEWSDERVLQTYREQRIIEGHTGFRWLKDVASVAPVFLKTPSRIAALGLVLMLALMVRNYLEWAVREALAKSGETLPNLNNQPTARPTTENVFYYFRDLRVSRIKAGGKVIHRELEGMRPEGRAVLKQLGWSEEIFMVPSEKLWRSGG